MICRARSLSFGNEALRVRLHTFWSAIHGKEKEVSSKTSVTMRQVFIRPSSRVFFRRSFLRRQFPWLFFEFSWFTTSPFRRNRNGGPNSGGPAGENLPEPELDENGEIVLVEFTGILEMQPQRYGFLRSSESNYSRERTDPFVPVR